MSDTKKTNYKIRLMRLSDCDQVRDLWTSVGFSVHKYTNEGMMKADPEGIFVAEDTDTGKILGYCSAVNLSDDFAFVGGYCVLPDYRGQGIGQKLWNIGKVHMGLRNVGLYAFSYKMFELYRDHNNFKCVPDYKIIHFRGKFVANNNLINKIDGISLSMINDSNLHNVIEYDQRLYGLKRDIYIENMVKSPESVHLVALDGNNQVVGYCIVLATTSDAIGVEPLYADNELIAELLITNCCHRLPQECLQKTIIYKAFDYHHKAQAIAVKLGLKEVRDQMMAFTKRVETGDLVKVYSIASVCFYSF